MPCTGGFALPGAAGSTWRMRQRRETLRQPNRNRRLCLAHLAALAAVMLGLALATPGHAAPVTFSFNWTGDAGYSARGLFTYDAATAPATIEEFGDGPTDNLSALSVSFFDPFNSLLQSFDTVSAGVSNSPFFQFNFDTKTQSVFGFLNIGGGSGAVAGDRFFLCSFGPSDCRLRVIGDDDVLDIAFGDATFDISAVPEPATVALVGLALVGVAATRSRKLSIPA